MSATHLSGPLVLGADSIAVIGAAKTLTSDDDGMTFMLTTDGTDGATIVLPLHAAGFRVKFIIGALFATTDWVIDHNAATDDTMEGSVLVDGAHITIDAAKAVNFAAGADNIGDWASFLSDGTTWFVEGSGLTSGAITQTA